MNKRVQILDCTLRDGGYANNWAFGQNCIFETIDVLDNSKIDFIECGFLTSNIKDSNHTLFNDVSKLAPYLSKNFDIKKAVFMLKVSDYDISLLPEAANKYCSIIRVIFKKYQIKDAIKSAQELINKGYKIFLNPTFITLYTEDEIKTLLDKVNKLKPFGFSLVDSIGSLDKVSLNKLVNLADNRLDESISLCLHTHNSLQLSMANAQEFLNSNINRNIILDSSLYGMGRGAGNLQTEVIADYLNTNYSKKYDVQALYRLLDKYYYDFYESCKWGFSLKYYLCAKLGLHTDYGYYLVKKCNINHSRASKILSLIPREKREIFDKKLIQELVEKYSNEDFILTK